mmetsp:Transcript_53317/g.122527  ORF Transcript_53317/g.122527 Transcript_53317/m.122527 type:complete len:295 (-) Transcript_53317:1397-2281(-)
MRPPAAAMTRESPEMAATHPRGRLRRQRTQGSRRAVRRAASRRGRLSGRPRPRRRAWRGKSSTVLLCGSILSIECAGRRRSRRRGRVRKQSRAELLLRWRASEARLGTSRGPSSVCKRSARRRSAPKQSVWRRRRRWRRGRSVRMRAVARAVRSKREAARPKTRSTWRRSSLGSGAPMASWRRGSRPTAAVRGEAVPARQSWPSQQKRRKRRHGSDRRWPVRGKRRRAWAEKWQPQRGLLRNAVEQAAATVRRGSIVARMASSKGAAKCKGRSPRRCCQPAHRLRGCASCTWSG